MSRFYCNLIATLKKALRARGLSYRDVAEQTQTPLSTLKRMFTQADGSIGRLEDLAEKLGLDFSVMCREASQEKEEAIWYRFTEEQEKHFCTKPACFHFFELIHKEKLSLQRVEELYDISRAEIEGYLKALEDLSLLERTVSGFRFTFVGQTAWLMGGPLQNTWILKDMRNFISENSQTYVAGQKPWKDEFFCRFFSLRLSTKNRQYALKALREFLDNLEERSAQDALLVPQGELMNTQWLVMLGDTALKPWHVLPRRVPEK